MVKRFRAKIYLNEVNHPIIPGSKYNFHFGLITQLGTIKRLVAEYEDSEFKKLIKKKPRLLNSRAFAEVKIRLDKRTPMENIINFKPYSTFQISNEFDTIGFGHVTELIR